MGFSNQQPTVFISVHSLTDYPKYPDVGFLRSSYLESHRRCSRRIGLQPQRPLLTEAARFHNMSSRYSNRKFVSV
jgi:hypothetical protein